ncbi:MAG: sigma-54 interaction domain-containing protein [Candidatus Fimivivens sp.]
MDGLLLKVQDTVQKYANIMSQIAGIDVEVVDSDLYRVAGTGIYANSVNQDMSGEGCVYRHTIKTGQIQFIDNPGENPLCQKCNLWDQCKEAIEISKPIHMDQSCIGVIGLVGSSQAQKVRILENKEMYLAFLEQIAEFIAGKARDFYEASRRESIINSLHLVTNHITQGVLVIGRDEIITNANQSAKKQLGSEMLEGLHIGLKSTGDRLSHGTEYRVQLKGKEILIYGKIYAIPNPSLRYGQIMIFSDSETLHEQVYEMTHVVNQIEVDGMIGSSPSTLELKQEIAKIAQSTSTVLITGESGTGKEVAATAIWKRSARKNKKFVAINCGAIPEALLEAELFGYVKGAFTGADPHGRIGKFELADQGVLFLDEIGDMPLYLQVKILRVLQERKIVRIGSNQQIPVDVRIIAATNRNLKEMIAAKKFREDLYYRLNVIPLKISPLRNRPQDIEALAYHFAARYAERFGKEFRGIAAESMLLLRTYPWRGNVRELENTLEFMINMMGETKILDNATLPKDFFEAETACADDNAVRPLHQLEKMEIQKALEQFGHTTAGKKTAAKSLGIGLATLYRKIEQHALHS